eukprot:m.39980 g.39980  ORF g.39980 m.39980 type:complete len:74 (-) comp14778_c0_seq1:147-368(-)
MASFMAVQLKKHKTSTSYQSCFHVSVHDIVHRVVLLYHESFVLECEFSHQTRFHTNYGYFIYSKPLHELRSKI